MTDKRTFRLVHRTARQAALEAVRAANEGWTVVVQPPTRNLDQSAKFHALCTDMARSGVEWAGKRRTAAQWKVLFVSGHTVATGGSAEIVPGLENEFVNIRESTAQMSVSRFSSLIEYAQAWCATHGVKLVYREAG